MTIPTLVELTELRREYHERVKAHVGDAFIDMAISAPGALFILEQLDKRWHDAVERGQLGILDMGVGFSTAFIHRWALEHVGTTYCGVDHSADWLAFMAQVDTPDWLTLELRSAFEARAQEQAPFDVIIVDHGHASACHMQTRASDVPWLVTLLKPDGIMLFDDWRPKHEGRIRRALAAVGGGWHIEAPEHVRRWPRDKSIGLAWREA